MAERRLSDDARDAAREMAGTCARVLDATLPSGATIADTLDTLAERAASLGECVEAQQEAEGALNETRAALRDANDEILRLETAVADQLDRCDKPKGHVFARDVGVDELRAEVDRLNAKVTEQRSIIGEIAVEREIANAENMRLKAALSNCEDALETAEGAAGRWLEELAEAKQNNEGHMHEYRLMCDRLTTYGQHWGTCDIRRDPNLGCDCGWHALRLRLGTGRSDTRPGGRS